MKKYLLGLLKYLFYKKNSKLSLITNDSVISNKAKINRFVKIYSSSISDFSYIGPKSEIVNTKIGKFCSIAGDCRIGLGSHTLDFLSTSPIFTERSNGTGSRWVNKDIIDKKFNNIEVGNDVWIGARVIVYNGNNEKTLMIGHGAIIGAGAVVTKDIPPYAIVGGIPAKIIRYRFEPEIIKLLLELKWWNLTEMELKERISFFQNDNITIELLEKFKSI